ncbi:MAG TPA: type I methionyl aminopeptidase [Coriobacteriia bacterium]|nr:type I methionyl aminopeptidase [Coriobacteriia bacterium]
MIVTKSAAELEIMREAGRITAAALRLVGEAVRPGVTTAELDTIAEEYIRSEGAAPAFKGYQGFPATLCTSPNDQVVHGIPGRTVLREGDILSVDCGAIVDGYYGDSALTFAVGAVSEATARLLEVTAASLQAAIAECRPGNHLSDVSHAVQAVVEAAGFSVVREYVGHGIGRAMHEEPQVPNYGRPGKGPQLKQGMALAIEPMVNAGGYGVHSLDDGWTVVTDDGLPSAHFEHTVAITADGPRVLTTEG